MKFLHIGDVHLGAKPDPQYPWSARRAEDIWESFTRVIELVKQEQIELLLLTGDLFHRQPLYGELKEINSLFSTIPNTAVALIAGNHDYLRRDSGYLKFPWAGNVHGLWEPRCQRIELPKLSVFLYGLSYTSREIPQRLYDGLVPGKEAGCHILLAHGGDDRHIPMDFSRLTKAGFDYVALGHIHKPQILGSRMAYAGALEPLDRNDKGKHGFIRGEWNEGRVQIAFVPFARSNYIEIKLPVRSQTTQHSLEEQITYEIRHKGVDHLYQIRLTGFLDPHTRLDMERLRRLGNILEIIDETTPDYPYQELQRKYGGTLIGDYIARFQNHPQNAVEKKALFYGLQALLGEKL